ncbi:MAG TPA: hypothetical protein VKA01_17370, partial [Vicinamibacteria bacterium]|nr:hypothetical protein [Vicinamibacteria bacterium]
MDGALIALFALFLLGLLLLAPVLAIVALTRTSALRGEVQALQARLRLLEARVGRAAPTAAEPA